MNEPLICRRIGNTMQIAGILAGIISLLFCKDSTPLWLTEIIPPLIAGGTAMALMSQHELNKRSKV